MPMLLLVGGHVEPSWAHAIDGYLTSAAAGGYSPATLRLRAWQLRWLATQIQPAGPWDVGTVDLERVLAANPDWQRQTRRSRLSAVRAFYRWAWRVGQTEVNLAALLPGVRVPLGMPRPCPEPALAAALAAADDRLRLMLLLGSHMGLRAGEIARVHRDDLGEDNRLTVRGKGDKVRLVPVVEEEIAAGLRSARGWVFPGRDGPMTSGHVTKLVSAALPDRWTCHTLRHRFGTRLWEETHDLAVVQEVLGHASPVTARIYVAVPPSALLAAMTRVAASPVVVAAVSLAG